MTTKLRKTEVVMSFRWAIDFPGTARPMEALYVDETGALPDLRLPHGMYVELGEQDRITVTIEPGDRLNA